MIQKIIGVSDTTWRNEVEERTSKAKIAEIRNSKSPSGWKNEMFVQPV